MRDVCTLVIAALSGVVVADSFFWIECRIRRAVITRQIRKGLSDGRTVRLVQQQSDGSWKTTAVLTPSPDGTKIEYPKS